MIAACLAPAATVSQSATPISPFDGAWLMDLDASNDASEPTIISLRRGLFTRGDSSSPVTVKADGRFHRISGGSYVDEIAVTVKDRSHINEINRFRGRIVYSLSYTASADGNTMINKVVDYSKPDHKPVITQIIYRRKDGQGASNSLVSGRWSAVRIETPTTHLTSIFKVSAGRLSSSEVGGSGFDAIIGGPPVPIRGDAETGRVAITMPDDRTIIEHMSINGTPTVTVTMVLLPGDRTIKVTGRRTGATTDFSWIMHKQD